MKFSTPETLNIILAYKRGVNLDREIFNLKLNRKLVGHYPQCLFRDTKTTKKMARPNHNNPN